MLGCASLGARLRERSQCRSSGLRSGEKSRCLSLQLTARGSTLTWAFAVSAPSSNAHLPPRWAGLRRWDAHGVGGALPRARAPVGPADPGAPLPPPPGDSRARSLARPPAALTPGVRAEGNPEPGRPGSQSPRTYHTAASTAGTARRLALTGAASWPRGRERPRQRTGRHAAPPPGGRRTQPQPTRQARRQPPEPAGKRENAGSRSAPGPSTPSSPAGPDASASPPSPAPPPKTPLTLTWLLSSPVGAATNGLPTAPAQRAGSAPPLGKAA